METDNQNVKAAATEENSSPNIENMELEDVAVSFRENAHSSLRVGNIRRLINIPNFKENSVAVLNTLLSPLPVNFEIVGEEGLPHSKIFTVQFSYKDQQFIGKGNRKKLATANVARTALLYLLGTKTYNSFATATGMTPNTLESIVDTVKFTKKVSATRSDSSSCNQTFEDVVSKLVTDKFEELVKGNEFHREYKVLAGVVMTKGTGMLMMETASVIAVATGTKCIEGDFMSQSGFALNDSHAEILANRCVRDFFYTQLEKLSTSAKGKEENIFGFDCDSDKIILKNGIKFHLFISTSPCGDARLFSPKGIEAGSDAEFEDNHPNRINRGILRAKIEAGEGTIPVANLPSGPQTWDGIVQGNALYTMSCSDKLCRWNVTGFQGALLANLINPVYYSSIILGGLHHPIHFYRAIYGRMEHLTPKIEFPFRVHKPSLLMVANNQQRQVRKSPNHSIAWAHEWSSYELISPTKGYCEIGNVPSRLSKRVAYCRFLQLQLSDQSQGQSYLEQSYRETKWQAGKYQWTIIKFKEYMRRRNFGIWISKPFEQEDFYITM